MGPRATSKRSFSTSRCTIGDLVHRLDADLVAGGDVLEQVRLGVGVAQIGAGAVGDDGLVEALLKLAAQAQDAAFGFFGELLLRGAIFDGADGLAHLELEVLEQRGQLGFELAGAVAQLDVAFAGQLGALLIERVLLLAGGLAFGFKLGEFVVQLVEEAGDVHLLRAEALAGGGDDVGVQAEALGGLDAGRCAGNAEAKLVVGREGQFIHAGRGVEHAGGVGGVDLERGVVRGDERPRAGGEKVAGDGDGQCRAFFGIGGGAELVEQDQRLAARPAARGGRGW